MTDDERAFLPALLEIIETPPSPTLRWTALALCGFIVSAITWAAIAEIDMVASAEGKIVPLGQVKVVQPLETAIVRGIHVAEGDNVSAGQLLVELDPTEALADLDTLRYDRSKAMIDAEVARALLVRDVDVIIANVPEADPVLVDHAREQATSELMKHFAAMEAMDADIAQKSAQRLANEAQRDRARAVIPLLEEKRTTAAGLYEKRFGARQPVLDAEQQLIERKADLRNAEEVGRQIDAEIRALEARKRELRATFTADATDRRAKALQRMSQLTQEITKTRRKGENRRLVAPVDGTVHGIKIHTSGAVVTAADTLMIVVPAGVGIEADVAIQNKDIGFVEEGQPVQIKIEAFPFTRFGLIEGKVRKLSRDALSGAMQAPTKDASGAAQSSELLYPAKIELNRDTLDVNGRKERLRPGMRVTAEIKTGTRKALDFVLSPVLKTFNEAGRER